MSIEAESLRAELRAAIAESDDPHIRALLLLMQGLYAITADGFQSLSAKIDNVLANEHELREKVLNGHAPDFDATMKWVKAEIAFSTRQKAINRWVEERMQAGGHCDWAAIKIDEEKEASTDNRKSFRRFRDSLAEKLFYVVLGAAALGALQMIK
jgi:hypothetical protein